MLEFSDRNMEDFATGRQQHKGQTDKGECRRMFSSSLERLMLSLQGHIDATKPVTESSSQFANVLVQIHSQHRVRSGTITFKR